MHAIRRSRCSAFFSITRASATALLVASIAADSLVAQVQAFYPLATDLLDATNNYGPMTLAGNPPPAPPSSGVCVNGIYFYNPGGQDAQTPNLTTLDTTDFQIDVDFNISALPAFQSPVIMGGHLWRWLGIYLQSNGIVGIKHNNSNYAWSTTTLAPGTWYTGSLRHEAGEAQLFIDGVLVLQVTTGLLSDGNNKNITTNDFSNGLNFNGCIRNLLILNDTTIVATAAVYGAGCAGSAGVPSLAPANTPQLGTTFMLNATNLEPAAALAFMAVGLSATTSPFGPLPFNLQPLGFGASCDLLVSADAVVLFGVAGGSGTFNFPVPPGPQLVGVAFYLQCASIDPGATGGIAVSNGVVAAVGY